MCTVLTPPGVNAIAVIKYIIYQYRIIYQYLQKMEVYFKTLRIYGDINYITWLKESEFPKLQKQSI